MQKFTMDILDNSLEDLRIYLGSKVLVEETEDIDKSIVCAVYDSKGIMLKRTSEIDNNDSIAGVVVNVIFEI
ncbi:hypothetical protein [Bacillus sp. FJAT-26390]|uniref:hypothetical protein n=1 Tax=Bacillus sp. FJAT-26390 TaxID=1743142 RepID=UPI000807BF25|nr:hypothetical protein [Bacillus sp. FJAT-26390]OBZ08029.1 hypothetical protein A7975_27260 [Bacillus sp. FJAT-26390]